MASGVITLTTDFGLRDHYVGVMKGVILGIHPGARIVDICHQTPAYDLLEGCFSIGASYPYFPSQTVHVVVIDPGVGGARRPIAAEAGEQLFVAPDNGVLELVYRRHPHSVWALRAGEFARQPTSATFHGRDVFAPAAALLSKGVAPDKLGNRVEDYARLEIPVPVETEPGRWRGQILKADRFGNLVTNFEPHHLPKRFLLVAGQTMVQNLQHSYAEAPSGEFFAITGSSGFIEISMNRAPAAEKAGVAAGDAVMLVAEGAGE